MEFRMLELFHLYNVKLRRIPPIWINSLQFFVYLFILFLFLKLWHFLFFAAYRVCNE